MRLVSTALFLLAVALPVFSTKRGLLTVEKTNDETNGKHIITLKEGADKATLISQVKTTANVTDEWDIINGFAAHLDTTTLDFLRAHSDVAVIAEDSLVSISDVIKTQTNATWGLERISQAAPISRTDTSSLNYTYRYDSAAGAGVDIYIVDTGIYTAHSTFQGRATWGATFGGYVSKDGNGHGTHVAGTAAGYDYGVAKSAHLIAVKAIGDSGYGWVSNVVSSLNWIRSEAALDGRPSVVVMSFTAYRSSALDSASESLTKTGIHVIVAAGNQNTYASIYSPARAPSALTVGASDITDTCAEFSNYGLAVKVFAPGVNVISSWIGSPTASKSHSGTSTAAPYVGGIVAYLIWLNENAAPQDMVDEVQELALKGKLKNIPARTVNYLAQY